MSAPCNCDQALQLRAELETVRAELELTRKALAWEEGWDMFRKGEFARVKAERDYLLSFADPKEIAQMRRELAAEWEARQGWPATPEDLGPIG